MVKFQCKNYTLSKVKLVLNIFLSFRFVKKLQASFYRMIFVCDNSMPIEKVEQEFN